MASSRSGEGAWMAFPRPAVSAKADPNLTRDRKVGRWPGSVSLIRREEASGARLAIGLREQHALRGGAGWRHVNGCCWCGVGVKAGRYGGPTPLRRVCRVASGSPATPLTASSREEQSSARPGPQGADEPAFRSASRHGGCAGDGRCRADREITASKQQQRDLSTASLGLRPVRLPCGRTKQYGMLRQETPLQMREPVRMGLGRAAAGRGEIRCAGDYRIGPWETGAPMGRRSLVRARTHPWQIHTRVINTVGARVALSVAQHESVTLLAEMQEPMRAQPSYSKAVTRHQPVMGRPSGYLCPAKRGSFCELPARTRPAHARCSHTRGLDLRPKGPIRTAWRAASRGGLSGARGLGDRHSAFVVGRLREGASSILHHWPTLPGGRMGRGCCFLCHPTSCCGGANAPVYVAQDSASRKRQRGEWRLDPSQPRPLPSPAVLLDHFVK